MQSLSDRGNGKRNKGHSKGRPATPEDYEQEKQLATLLFGGGSDPATNIIEKISESKHAQKLKKQKVHDADFIPLGSEDSAAPTPADAAIDGKEEDDTPIHVPSEPASAWVDADDLQQEVNIASGRNRLRKLRTAPTDEVISGADYVERLRTQHRKLNKGTEWALPQTEEQKAADAELAFLRTTETLLANRKGRELAPNRIEVFRLKDANATAPSNCVVQSVEFHPRGQLMLTAGFDKTLRLFQVDGKNNALVKSVFFEDLPLSFAGFASDGTEVLCTGEKQHFYFYDLQGGTVQKVLNVRGINRDETLERVVLSPDGQQIAMLAEFGNIHILHGRTKQLIGTMKSSGHVRCAAFSNDGSRLLSTGKDGRVFEWDMRTRRCVHAFVDEGAIRNTAIALSPDGKWQATGSLSGVVNVYSSESTHSNDNPKPQKMLMNLQTRIRAMKFNHDSQLMCMISHRQKDALRLVHFPTMTVFSNWPTSRTPLHYVEAIDFSPHSGFLAIGNARGNVLLYRIPHYDSV